MTLTWEQAKADPQARWRWLVRLTAQGLDARYSDDECDIGGVHWRRGLEISGEPSLGADPYEGRASLSPFTISLLPELADPSAPADGQALVDLDVVMGYGGGDITVDLWRWPDDVEFDAAAVLVRGVADKPSMDTSGTIALSCISFLDLYDVQYPVATCEQRLHADVAEQDQGAGYPLLLGEYFNSECPEIDTTNDKHLIASEYSGHQIASATMYRDGLEDADASIQHSNDTEQNFYAFADFPADTDGVAITASGEGLKDDTAGTYTGTASAVMHHPADQLHFLAAVAAAIPADNIDVSSFVTVRDTLPRWKTLLSVESTDQVSYLEMVERLCKWLRGAQIPERGKVRLRLCQFDAAPVMTLDETNTLDAQSIEWGDKEKIVTRYLAYYDYGWHDTAAETRYLKSLSYNLTDSAALALAEARYGRRYSRREPIETREINETQTMLGALVRYAQLREKMRRVVEVRGDATTHDLKIFDVVLLDISWLPWWQALDAAPKPMVVTGIRYGLADNLLTLMEC